jgi:hypothetical protein
MLKFPAPQANKAGREGCHAGALNLVSDNESHKYLCSEGFNRHWCLEVGFVKSGFRSRYSVKVASILAGKPTKMKSHFVR